MRYLNKIIYGDVRIFVDLNRPCATSLIDTQLKDMFDRDWTRQRNDAQVVREVQPRGKQED